MNSEREAFDRDQRNGHQLPARRTVALARAALRTTATVMAT